MVVLDSGGGSGGHIAIHLAEHYRFDGSVQSLGGDGYTYLGTRGFASPGTVFRLSHVGDDKIAQLLIDHQNWGDASCTHAIYLPLLQEVAALTLLRTACARVAQVGSCSCVGGRMGWMEE